MEVHLACNQVVLGQDGACAAVCNREVSLLHVADEMDGLVCIRVAEVPGEA